MPLEVGDRVILFTDGVDELWILYATGGVVRLFRWAGYSTDWNPESDTRLPVWESG